MRSSFHILETLHSNVWGTIGIRNVREKILNFGFLFLKRKFLKFSQYFIRIKWNSYKYRSSWRKAFCETIIFIKWSLSYYISHDLKSWGAKVDGTWQLCLYLYRIQRVQIFLSVFFYCGWGNPSVLMLRYSLRYCFFFSFQKAEVQVSSPALSILCLW